MSANNHGLWVRIDAALQSHPHLQQAHIRVMPGEGRDGARRVLLAGRVASWFQKQMAQETVRQFDEVEAIDNQLVVEPPFCAPELPDITMPLFASH